MSVEIRSYCPSDLEAIKKIHEASGLDYKLPNLNSPYFMVNKILEVDGEVKAAYGMRAFVECYLWMDKSRWADAEEKWLAIKALDREATEAAAVIGIDDVTCYVPPGLERFGRRISGKDGLGFKRDRAGWISYTKHAGERSK